MFPHPSPQPSVSTSAPVSHALPHSQPLHGPLDSASQPSLESGPEGPRALPYLVSTPSMQEEEAAKENLRPKW